jgi:hypothetical protein
MASSTVKGTPDDSKQISVRSVHVLEIPRVEIGNIGIAMRAATSQLRCEIEAADRKKKANQSERRIPPTCNEARDGSRTFNRHSRSSLTYPYRYALNSSEVSIEERLQSVKLYSSAFRNRVPAKSFS